MNNEIFDSYHNWTSEIISEEDIKLKITGRYWNRSFNSDNLTSKTNEILLDLKLKSILDYGAGMGRNLDLLRKYSPVVDYIDFDVYKEYAKNLKYDNIFFIKMEIDKFEKKYDLIYSSLVIQHIKNEIVMNSIIDFMHKNAKHVFLVQNSQVPLPSFGNDFKLINSELYTDDFTVDHVYNLYKVSN